MAGTKFGDSFDPAFDVRAADMSKTATVQQETADAADGGNAHVAAPEPAPAGGDDDNTIEQIGGNLGDAAGDALLAAASVAPPLAAAAAVIDQGEALLDAGKDAANFANDAAGEVGGALDDLFGGGDDVPPGTSTFDVDPNDDGYVPGYHPPGSPEAVAAQQAAADAAERQADVAEAKAGKVQDANAEAGGIYQDPRYEDVSDHAAHTQVDDTLDLETGIAGAGASAGAVGAPDGAYEPVSASQPHTGIGFIPEGADVGAPHDVFEPVSESAPHTTVGTGDAGAPDGVFEPVSESDPHTSVGGADAGAPDGVFEPVAESDPHTTVGFVPAADDLPTVDGVQTEVPVGSDVQLNPQPIPPGLGADIGEPLTEAAASAMPDVADSSIIIVGGTEAAVGADLGGGGDAVSLNPQPIPPGMDGGLSGGGAEVSLNPQPIPPGIGADIGEPVADAAAAAPSTTDSSIIIVGGTEAPVFSDVSTASAEAPVVADIEVADAPMEDVASTIAVELDSPSVSAEDSLDTPIEMSIDEEAIDG